MIEKKKKREVEQWFKIESFLFWYDDQSIEFDDFLDVIAEYIANLKKKKARRKKSR